MFVSLILRLRILSRYGQRASVQVNLVSIQKDLYRSRRMFFCENLECKSQDRQ